MKNYGTAEASATKPKFELACILQRSRVMNSGAQTITAAHPLALDNADLKNVRRCCPAALLQAFNTACGVAARWGASWWGRLRCLLPQWNYSIVCYSRRRHMNLVWHTSRQCSSQARAEHARAPRAGGSLEPSVLEHRSMFGSSRLEHDRVIPCAISAIGLNTWLQSRGPIASRFGNLRG